jgi:hypothetical protein
VDLFIKRLLKMKELFGIINQFRVLKNHQNLEGVNDICKSFENILEEFKKKNHNMLEFDNIKLEKDYVELMQKILKLD